MGDFRKKYPVDWFRGENFKIENTPIKDTSGKRKFKRMLGFLFVYKPELFAMKLSFEEFNLFFLPGRLERLACFEPTGAARFLKKLGKLEIHSVLYGHRKYVFKREFLCLQRFHGRFLHFDIGVKEKPQNVHLKLIFCHVLSWLNLRQRIQDLVSVMRELLLRLTYEFFN